MANVTFNFNPAPAPACYPSDVNGLAQLLTTGGILAGSVPDNSGAGIFVGVNPPPSSITNQVWFRIDALGRPTGILMFYSGNWRRVYTGVGLGEIRMWSGLLTGVFDGTGLGIVGGDMDGWALCNGNNGTPNLTNQFITGSTNYSNGWTATPGGAAAAHSGGDGVIRCVNLPNLWTSGYTVEVSTGVGGGAQVVTNIPSAQAVLLPVEDVGNNCHPSGQSPLMPPWYALAFIQFIGY